jgi:hypothetical protein
MQRKIFKVKKMLFSKLIYQQSKLLLIMTCILQSAIYMAPANAISARLGVVKSQENTPQWESISKRLKATGVDYCIVDETQWKDETDLGEVKVLLLPNVDNIEQAQAIALSRWAARGGRIIVTGPTGNLSQSDVKMQLRSLFGAYWAYSNSSPVAIAPVGSELAIDPQDALTPLVGGTLIPTSGRVTAIWLEGEQLPAIVVSNRVTFLGWRWGAQGVAPENFDIATLESALARFGIGPNNQISILKRSEPVACNDSSPLVPSLEPSRAPLNR